MAQSRAGCGRLGTMKKDEMPEKIGRYEIIRKLGKGATASVYLARDSDSDLQVAIKLIEFDSRGTALRRRLEKLFKTEIDVARKLDHPNIVHVHDAVINEEHAYIVMEYVEGSPLDAYASADRLLPMDRVIGIAFKCALALDHAAQRGVVHRDIKPANILVDKDDNPKLTDFGLALFLQKDMEQDSTFVMGVGSPAYMSPEQVKGYPLSHKTDLYSLGVVLFQLLTGRLPYRASNQAALIYKIINAEIPDITKLNPQLPAEVGKIMHRVLEKDTYTRYRSGADFAKDLTAVRYGIVGEKDDGGERDHKRFGILRHITFFKAFDDLELWEALRLCVWRDLEPKVTLMQEGEADKRFHIIVAGLVEVSTSGKALCRLGAGEVVGEMAYLHPDEPLRNATVVTLEPTTVVEFNAAALNLSSEELQEAFQKVLITTVLNRLRAANAALAKHGDIAIIGSPMHRGDLELAPPIDL